MAAGPAVAMATTVPRPAGCPGAGARPGPVVGWAVLLWGRREGWALRRYTSSKITPWKAGGACFHLSALSLVVVPREAEWEQSLSCQCLALHDCQGEEWASSWLPSMQVLSVSVLLMSCPTSVHSPVQGSINHTFEVVRREELGSPESEG